MPWRLGGLSILRFARGSPARRRQQKPYGALQGSSGRSMLRPMAEEPIAFLRAGLRPAARTAPWGGAQSVRFDRRELDRILNIYGRMVAAGEWRDYAIDFLEDRAVFSVYRHASQAPLFTIEKRPELKSRQGQYVVLATTGHVLKRGHDLAQVLRLFDRKLLKVLQGA
jgi:hypothetical protein